MRSAKIDSCRKNTASEISLPYLEKWSEIMFRYKLLRKKGEGTFSEVLKAQNIETGSLHAIKCMKQTFSSLEQVNSLREIQALRRLSPHPNIIILQEVLFDKLTGKLALVFELMHANLYDVIRERDRPFSAVTVQGYTHQIMNCIAFIHNRGVFHRDIKPENILVDVTRKNLKLADFGSVRGTHSRKPYTEYISTRWYRAPECLLTDGHYGAEVDIWGAGCVTFEIIALTPLFPGSDEIDQINKIHQILGSPPPLFWMNLKIRGSRNLRVDFPVYKGSGFVNLIPRARQDCLSFLHSTLKYDATERITASQALEHTYLASFNAKLLEETTHKERAAKITQNNNGKLYLRQPREKIAPAKYMRKMQTEARPIEVPKGSLPSPRQHKASGKTSPRRTDSISNVETNNISKKVPPLTRYNNNMPSASTAIQIPANSGYSSSLPSIQGDNAASSTIEKLLVSSNKEQTSKKSLPLLADLCRGGKSHAPVIRKKPSIGTLPLTVNPKSVQKHGAQSSVAAASSLYMAKTLLPPIKTMVSVGREESKSNKSVPFPPFALTT